VLASTPSLGYPPFTTKLKVVINNPPNSPAQGSLLWWLSGLFGLGLLMKRRSLMRSGAWRALTLLWKSPLPSPSSVPFPDAAELPSFLTPKGTSTVTVIAASDPYATGDVGTTTQSCGINASKNPDPTLAPCAEQRFQVTLNVQ